VTGKSPGRATLIVDGGIYGKSSINITVYKFSLHYLYLGDDVQKPVYNGKAQEPEVLDVFGDTTKTTGRWGLIKDQDYTVSYEDNVKPGIAKVTVKGIGFFWGSKKLKFIISGRENTKEGTMQSYDGIHGLQLSSIFDDGKLIYKVTKEGTLDGKTAGKVTVIGLKKKTLKKVTVKASVNYGGVKYKVTAIGKKAFKKGDF
jgi:hypothetical protein